MRQLLTFAAVGIAATAMHYMIAVFAIEIISIKPLYANFIAYLSAVALSYIGHSALTFKVRKNKYNALRFFVVSIGTFGMSQMIVYFLTNYSLLSHRLVFLVVVFSIPIFSFILNKYWVYNKSKN